MRNERLLHVHVIKLLIWLDIFINFMCNTYLIVQRTVESSYNTPRVMSNDTFSNHSATWEENRDHCFGLPPFCTLFMNRIPVFNAHVISRIVAPSCKKMLQSPQKIFSFFPSFRVWPVLSVGIDQMFQFQPNIAGLRLRYVTLRVCFTAFEVGNYAVNGVDCKVLPGWTRYWTCPCGLATSVALLCFMQYPVGFPDTECALHCSFGVRCVGSGPFRGCWLLSLSIFCFPTRPGSMALRLTLCFHRGMSVWMDFHALE